MIRKHEFLLAAALVAASTSLLSHGATAAQSLAQTLSGRILLQVEQHGEAWYVYPESTQRYYLGRPADAFEIMRNLGLGISNADLAKIPEAGTSSSGDLSLRNRLSGTILLQVQENGEAWYVYPENKQRYYLGRPEDAFRIMRELGLGISDENLLGIPVAPESKTPFNNGTTTQQPTQLIDGHEQTRIAILKILNDERLLNGLADYRLNTQLSMAAQNQSNDMASRQYFDLTSPDGKKLSDWVAQTAYRPHIIAQNLVQTNQGINTLINIWKENNGSSYENVVSPQYFEVGIGIGEYQGIETYNIVFAKSLENYFSDVTSNLQDLEQVRTEMLTLINEARQGEGLTPVTIHSQLNQAAQTHADDMLARSYYAHISPEGTNALNRVTQTGYPAHLVGENIAKGQISVQEVMEGWLASPGHRANILNPNFKEVGIGLSYGQNQNGYELIWTQNFGTQQ